MQDVNIYIHTSIRGPGRRDGGYIYILECMVREEPVTREGTGSLEGTTENQLALTALAEALSRLNQPCALQVFTRCQHILDAVGNLWTKEWEERGWLNAKGKAIKNAEEWKNVLAGLDRHLYRFTNQPHPYQCWMEQELKRQENKNV